MGSSVRCFVMRQAGIEEMHVDAPTLDALSLRLPRGAYTTFRTYHGCQALHLAQHIDRLSESAAIEGYQLALDHTQVRAALAEALARSSFPEARVRLTLAYDPPGVLYISLEPFSSMPSSAYANGVRCSLSQTGLRRQRPEAKSTSFIAPASQARAATGDVNEILLVREDGAILEGSSSNFYAVLDGTLRTAGEGVLAGITRAMVLDLADGLLPVILDPVGVGDLARLEEAFITSVSRAVLPVVAIDQTTVGLGVPGPITGELGRRFNAYIERTIEPIAPESR